MNLTKPVIVSFLSLTFPLAALSEPVLSNPDARAYDISGSSIALDGDTLLTGAPTSNPSSSSSMSNEGRVYHHSYDGSAWLAQDRVLPLDSSGKDLYGAAVDIDDSLAVVGAPGAFNLEKTDRDPFLPGLGFRFINGAAYIHRSDGTHWTQAQALYPHSSHPWRNFGTSVAISNSTVAVGSTGSYSSRIPGAVHIYTEGPTGRWSQEAYIEADPEIGVSPEFDVDYWAMSSFGSSVALHNDVLAIGVPSFLSHTSTGAVAIYRRTAGTWEKEAIVQGSLFAKFGAAVAIQDNTLVVGAPGDEELLTGSVLVFEYDETSGDWNLSGRMIPDPDDPESNWISGISGRFGQSVSIDDGVIAVGMNASTWATYFSELFDEEPAAPDDFSGGVGAYVYRQHPATEEWVLVERLVEDDPDFFSGFGSSVDVSGDCVAVGANGRDGMAGEDEGGSYVFCDIPEVPFDHPSIIIDVECCDVPIDVPGSYTYSLELIHSKSVESLPATLLISIESPEDKITVVDETKVQLPLDGEPLKINGTFKLGEKPTTGKYKFSATLIKNSGNAIATHQNFDVK